MKRTTCFLVLLLIIIAGTQSANATYIASGDITYKHVSGDSFDVTLRLVRDCNGVTLTPPTLTVTSACKTTNYTLNHVSTTDVTGLNPYCGVQSRCSGSYTYGFEEFIYTKRIMMGGDTCCEYTLSYSQCCRNNNITTGAGGQNFFLKTTLNKCLAPTNSSPVFTSTARLLLPVGQNTTVDFNATDANYDALSYKLIEPLTGAGTSATYNGSWTPARPITFLGFPNAGLSQPAGFHLNNTTGIIGFRPTKQNEITVFTMEVSEWRVIGGVTKLIGTTVREMTQLVISSPNNKNPSITNLVDKIVSCDSLGTFCVDIEADDQDYDDTLTFDFFHQLDSVVIINIGNAKRPKMRVCVTLDSAEVASGKPLQIMAEVTDDACPLGLTAKQTFTFIVGPHMPDSFLINKNVSCREVEFGFNNLSSLGSVLKADFVITAPDSVYNYSASSSTPFVLNNVKTPGWYTAEMTVSSSTHCDTRTYIDSVFVPASNFMTLDVSPDTSICFTANYTVNSTVTNGNPPLHYSWNVGDTIPSITKALSPGKNKYVLEVTDANGCYAKDSAAVKYFNPTVTIIGDTVKCKNDIIGLTAIFTNTIKPTFQWLGFAPGDQTISPLLPASKQFVFTLVDSSGCVVVETHNVFASSPVIAFTHQLNQCVGDSIRLSATASGGIAPYSYNWVSFSQTGSDKIALAPSTSSGKIYFITAVNDALGCQHTDADSVVIQPLPTVSLTAPGTYCENKGLVSLSSLATPSGGIWSGNGVSGNNFNTTVSGDGTFSLQYVYTDPTTGCSNTKTTQIMVDEMPVADFFPSISSGNKPLPVTFFNTTSDTNAQWQWIIKDSAGATISTSFQRHFNYTFTADGKYTVVLIATSGLCTDTAEKISVVTVGNSVGIRGVETNLYRVYPNPVDKNGALVIEGENISHIELTDVLGRRIENLSVITTGNKATIDMAGVDAGVYQVQVFDKTSNSFTYKVVVGK